MSIGNAEPGPHAAFAGFSLDWEGLEVTPVDDRPVRTPTTASSEFAESLSDYVTAFSTISRPKGDDGNYLGRDPDAAEEREYLKQACAKIDQAAQRAEDAGEIDFPFRYARARVRHACEDYDAAAEDWSFLRSLFYIGGVRVHDYERALVLILSAATEFARGSVATATDFLDQGDAVLKQVRNSHFPGSGKQHADLYEWDKLIDALREQGAGAELPEFDFVTVE